MKQLFTDAMLDEAADALRDHRPRKGKCSCGAPTTNVDRHRAQVVADTWSPDLVAEMMHLLGEVAGGTVRRLRDAS